MSNIAGMPAMLLGEPRWWHAADASVGPHLVVVEPPCRDLCGFLGLQTGEASIISNADGVVTEDALRCLIIAHYLLDTNEIILSTTPAATCSRSEHMPDIFQTGAQLWPPVMRLLCNRKRRPAEAQGVTA